MPRTTTAVPIQGDRAYAKALKALAYQHGLTIGELVRAAVDNVYGGELAPHLAFFNAQSERRNVHKSVVTSRRKEPAR